MAHSNRRGFLQTAGVVPAAIFLPAAQASQPQGLGSSASELRRAHFQALIGQKFTLTAFGTVTESPADIRLKKVHALDCCEHPERSFRVVFESVRTGGGLRQDTWILAHPTLGTHTIFMSPNDAQGREIEAIFNRG